MHHYCFNLILCKKAQGRYAVQLLQCRYIAMLWQPWCKGCVPVSTGAEHVHEQITWHCWIRHSQSWVTLSAEQDVVFTLFMVMQDLFHTETRIADAVLLLGAGTQHIRTNLCRWFIRSSCWDQLHRGPNSSLCRNTKSLKEYQQKRYQYLCLSYCDHSKINDSVLRWMEIYFQAISFFQVFQIYLCNCFEFSWFCFLKHSDYIRWF